MRPWKAEQLGGGYRVSSFAERTAVEAAAAVVAVSAGMRARHPRQLPRARPGAGPRACTTASTPSSGSRGRDDGRRAPARHRPRPARRSSSSAGSPGRRGCPTCCAPRPRLPEVQLVLCAGAPDTPEILAEVEQLVADLHAHARRRGLDPRDAAARTRSSRCLSRHRLRLPVGLRAARASSTSRRWPARLAVVATATGGIPEVVVDGETGWLVPIEQVTDGSGTPVDPDRFVADLACGPGRRRLATPTRARRFGLAGRQRAVEHFSWASIGDRTMEVYRSVLG